MNKFFSLETKGEIVAILKHNEMSYMDFLKTCKEIEEREGTKDLYTGRNTRFRRGGRARRYPPRRRGCRLPPPRWQRQGDARHHRNTCTSFSSVLSSKKLPTRQKNFNNIIYKRVGAFIKYSI